METLLSSPTRHSNSLVQALLVIVVIGVLAFAVAWSVGGVTGMLVALPFWLAMCPFVLLRRHAVEVVYLSRTRRIKVRWKSPILGACQREFPVDRFESVVSYGSGYDDEVPKITVCLLERSGNRGLSLGSFPGKYVARSFWDAFSTLVEDDAAVDLRRKVSSVLGVRDAGYIGSRRPIRESLDDAN